MKHERTQAIGTIRAVIGFRWYVIPIVKCWVGAKVVQHWLRGTKPGDAEAKPISAWASRHVRTEMYDGNHRIRTAKH